MDKSVCKTAQTQVVAFRTTASRPTTATSLVASMQQLFSNCTLTESRFLLSELFEDAIKRGLRASRAQESESQLKATLSIREQERNQELEMLRLAMQQAGVPFDNLETVLPASTDSSAPDRGGVATTSVCPYHGINVGPGGCECCSGVPSSAVPSDESSDSDDGLPKPYGESATVSSASRSVTRPPNNTMSNSMYAALRGNQSGEYSLPLSQSWCGTVHFA